MPTNHYKKYDKRTNKKMNKLRKKGRKIRQPVRKVANASLKSLYDRARFIVRAAGAIIKNKYPLKDKKGKPTPAAMQFRRWALPTPSTYREIKKYYMMAKRQVKVYKKRLNKRK